MAHHGTEDFSPKFNSFSESMKADNFTIEHTRGKMQQELNATKINIGATGKFPEGKLNESDEGEIAIVIAVHENKVILNFGKPTHWVGLTKDQAREFGVYLIQKSEEI